MFSILSGNLTPKKEETKEFVQSNKISESLLWVGFFICHPSFVSVYFVMAHTWCCSQYHTCKHLLLCPCNTVLHLISSISKAFWKNQKFAPADFFHIVLRAICIRLNYMKSPFGEVKWSHIGRIFWSNLTLLPLLKPHEKQSKVSTICALVSTYFTCPFLLTASWGSSV